jgi:hypothetical protein
MSATYYTPGTLYTVGANPTIKLLNVRNTRTFSEFIVRGANTGPLTPGTKVRLRNYPDTAGPQVYPYGRATGQPGMVPVPPVPPLDPFWGNACSPTGAVTVGNLDNAFTSTFTQRFEDGQVKRWMYGFGTSFVPWTQVLMGYNAPDTWNDYGLYTLTTCIYNDTEAAVVPKIVMDAISVIGVTITGAFEMTWNDTVLTSVTDGTIALASAVFSAPPLPAGVAATSVIGFKVTNVTALTGPLKFKLTL